MKKKVFLFLIYSFFAYTLSEYIILFSNHPWVEYKIKEKAIHCFSDHLLSLCPGRTETLTHPLGFIYTVTTNSNGERVVPEKKGNQEIWILGDSISMGYGVSDEDSFPYLLADLSSYRIRNLAVDALGSGGILKKFKKALEKGRPDHAYWVFHFSDFQDDPRELKAENSFFFRWMLRTNHYLSSSSRTYNLLRYYLEEKKIQQRANTYEKSASFKLDENHPTCLFLKEAIELSIKEKIPLTFIFYPNVDHSTGFPGEDYAMEEAMMAFIRKNGGKTADFKPFFDKESKIKKLYLPRDGHPSRYASIIFAEETKKLISKER